MAIVIDKERTRERNRLYVDLTQKQHLWLKLNILHGNYSKLLQFLLSRFIEMPEENQIIVLKAMNRYFNNVPDDTKLEDLL